MAWRPSMAMSAPMRTISLACMKRFSKMVSVMTLVPLAWVASAMNCACMSVAKPGYSSVVMLAAASFFAPRTASRSGAGRADVHAGLAQLREHGGKMLGRTAGKLEFAAGNGSRDQKRARLDAVGNYSVGSAVQPLHAAHPQGGSAGALDARAHLGEQFDQVSHLGLARGVVDLRLALGQRRGHQDVFRAGHGDFLEGDARPAQPPAAGRARGHVAVLGGDFGTHLLQSLQVQVHGPRSDRAPARQRDARASQARERGSQREDRGAHGAHQFVRRLGVDDVLAPR